jgi:hypothetical protein
MTNPRRHRSFRRVLRLGLASCLIVAALLATSGGAGARSDNPAASTVSVVRPAQPDLAGSAAINLWVHVWANQVNARRCASTTNPLCTPITQINAGWYPYECTVASDRVNYGQYTNIYWSHIFLDLNGDGFYETGAWISDVFLSGGGNDQPAANPVVWC